MTKNLKKLIVASLFVGISVSAVTLEEKKLEELQRLITIGNLPELCEREATYIKKNPQECIKAATIPKERAYYVAYVSYEDYVASMFSNAGVIYKELGEYEKAVKMYEKALEILPNHSNAHTNMGVVYDDFEEYEKAVKMYEKALEISPNQSAAHTNMGVLYCNGTGIEMNKYKAYEHFQIAAKQGNSIAQKNLDILCRKSPWACK